MLSIAMLSIGMQTIIFLSLAILSIEMPSVIILIVVMLGIVILSVVMLIDVAFYNSTDSIEKHLKPSQTTFTRLSQYLI